MYLGKRKIARLKKLLPILGKIFPKGKCSLKAIMTCDFKNKQMVCKRKSQTIFLLLLFVLRNNYFFINLIMNVWCFFSGLKSIKKIILKKFGSLFLLILIQNFALFLFYNYIITNLQQLEEDICFILFYNSIIITSGGVRISI